MWDQQFYIIQSNLNSSYNPKLGLSEKTWSVYYELGLKLYYIKIYICMGYYRSNYIHMFFIIRNNCYRGSLKSYVAYNSPQSRMEIRYAENYYNAVMTWKITPIITLIMNGVICFLVDKYVTKIVNLNHRFDSEDTLMNKIIGTLWILKNTDVEKTLRKDSSSELKLPLIFSEMIVKATYDV